MEAAITKGYKTISVYTPRDIQMQLLLGLKKWQNIKFVKEPANVILRNTSIGAQKCSKRCSVNNWRLKAHSMQKIIN